ncbi:MAG: polysaccharide biosynthesis protein [Clostridia bacterium]|nr:polysaccharide biosynthesis protein [Clostridia bacterium]
MSRLKKFIINGIVLTVTALIMRTVALSFNAYITNKVGAECVGLYSLIMSVYGFSVTLATSGINLASTRMVSKYLGCSNPTRARESMMKCISYAVFFGSLSSILLFTLAEPIGCVLLGDRRTVFALKIMSVSMLPIAVSSCVNGYFTAIRHASKNAVCQIFEQTVRIILMTYLLLLLMPSGIEWACVALVAGGAIAEFASCAMAGVMYLLDRKLIGRGRTPKMRATTKEMLHISLPVAISSYVRSFLLTVEHMLIPKRLMRHNGKTQSEAMASYGALHGMALPIILYPISFIGSFSSLLVPEISESMASADSARVRRITEKAIRATLIFSIGCAGIMSVFSTALGNSIYSSSEAGRYIALIAPAIPIMYLDGVVDSVLKGIGEQVYSMGVNISDSALSIALVWIILPVYGASGYALVIIIAEIYNLSMSITRLHTRVKFKVSLMRSVFLPLLLSVGVCRLCSNLLFVNNRETPVSIALHIFICAAIYLVLAYPLTSLKKQEL